MSYTYANLAKSVVQATRPPGSPTLQLGAGDGELFGEPTAEAPMRCVVYGGKNLLTILYVIGRDGDTLNLGEPVSGYSDAEIPKGSIVANVLLANDLTDLWAAISEGVGQPGAPGSVWRKGSEVPDDSLGVDGDFYLRDNGDAYAREDGVYVLFASLRGPNGEDGQSIKGDPGEDGADGSKIRVDEGAPSDSLGADGDLYVDVSTWDFYQRDSGVYVKLGNIRGPKGDPGDGADIDESDLVHKSGDETLTGVKTLPAPRLVGGLSIVDEVGTTLSAFDDAGNGFTQTRIYTLAKGFDLVAGTGLVAGGLTPFAGKVAKVQIRAAVNGSSGGFSLQINNGSTPILASAFAVASSDTSVKTITGFAEDSVAAGDWFSIDASSVGTGVQDVEVAVTILGRNR